MKAKVTIYLKEGVLDPQAKAIHNAIKSFNIDEIKQVSIAKQITLDFASCDEEIAQRLAQKIAKDLLANPVIEDYAIEMLKAESKRG